MHLSLWFGIVLAGGQTGCSSLSKDAGGPPQINRPAMVQQVRPQMPPPQGRGLRNGDFYQIPKVPPPGARMTYNGVNISEPYVAMTFDDGPHPSLTPRLLNILKERNIKATFYVLGSNVQQYPHIIRRMLAEGHEIGNHTWSHPSLSSVSEASGKDQMARTARKVTELTGYQMRTMRPPYGATNDRVKSWNYHDFGYPTILWTVDPLDWKRPGASVVANRIIAGARPGAIILAHDIHAGTIDAMPAALDGLLAKGYRFVTVSQLLNMESRTLASAPPMAPAPPVIPAPQMLPPEAYPAGGAVPPGSFVPAPGFLPPGS